MRRLSTAGRVKCCLSLAGRTAASTGRTGQEPARREREEGVKTCPVSHFGDSKVSSCDFVFCFRPLLRSLLLNRVPDNAQPVKDLRIPDVVITSATPTPAGVGPQSGRTPSVELPAHCLVRGEIDRRVGAGGLPLFIGFELRLPDQWQDRFMFQGGGGMDGSVRPAIGSASGANRDPGLRRGFAVAATDAGHQGASDDPSFSRDQQARIDNAYRSIDRVTVVSKAIVAAYYGRPWKHAYFDGCSNGGRQALLSAQRFPTYFDGIVAGAPAFRVTHAAIGSVWETIRSGSHRAQGRPGQSDLEPCVLRCGLTSSVTPYCGSATRKMG